MLLTGRSLSSKMTSRSDHMGGNPSKIKALQPQSRNVDSTSTHDKKQPRKDPIILMDGHELKVSELYLMLKKKIIGRHPGGSHGILRCWKQFRRLAGAGRVGGGGQ